MRRLLAIALLAFAARDLRAQPSPTIEVSSHPMPRSFKADWHMGRATDLRHAGRYDAALVQLDSVLIADPDTRGVHTMRALVLAEKRDHAGMLSELRLAHAAGDTLAFPAAMQLGTSQYRSATGSRSAADLTHAMETLQLADSLAPTPERRAVPRLLVAATALSLASGELSQPGMTPGCPNVATARDRVRTALASLEGTASAPQAQVAQVRSALLAFSAYTELQARQLRCA